MPKSFCCSDLGIACDWVGTADTEEELLKIVADHAKNDHQMREMTDAILMKIKARIKDN